MVFYIPEVTLNRRRNNHPIRRFQVAGGGYLHSLIQLKSVRFFISHSCTLVRSYFIKAKDNNTST